MVHAGRIGQRSEVANSWRTERWDSLRLLTPNWQCRLPGISYDGGDPDGFMTMPEVVDFITDYATLIVAPVQSGTPVSSVRRSNGTYRVTTNQGERRCETVVIATGAFNVPHVPPCAEAVPSSVTTLTPLEYRNPERLGEGGVLVVGASALGLDLGSGEIETIIWATGFRPDYSWLDVKVLDYKGMIRHDGGVVDAPGIFLVGSPFLRRRKSSFIDGTRADAEELIVELSAYLDVKASSAGR